MPPSAEITLASERVVRTLDKDHCVATWDRVLIQVWHYSTTAKAVAELGTIAQRFIADSQRSISSIAIVERSSPPPSDEVRAALSQFYRDFAPKMDQQIVVAVGGGFRGALVRAVGLTLSTLAPNTLPFRFVGSIEEATTLLTPHLSATAGGGLALRRVIDGIREESLKVAAPST